MEDLRTQTTRRLLALVSHSEAHQDGLPAPAPLMLVFVENDKCHSDSLHLSIALQCLDPSWAGCRHPSLCWEQLAFHLMETLFKAD